ncbi:MAG: hypothetical protein JXC36_03260 [Candidatus Atribacteria bacterium]|nr:hypothetical protein [Candidatus Atribacteria bacterium]
MNNDRRNSGQWFFGFIVFIIGLIFLLENLMGIQIWERIWQFWPVIIILWGLVSLFQRRSIFFGIILLGVGALFLLKNFGIYQWPDTIWRFWPIAVIAIGIDQMFKHPEFTSSGVSSKGTKGKKESITKDDEII